MMGIFIEVPKASLLTELPNEVATLTSQERADILNQIANFSYRVLLEVPEKGLTLQRTSLEEVIALRKWLQARQQPLFQLQALVLREGVDRAIINELLREDLTKSGFKTHTPFKIGSFNSHLLESLLHLNEFSESAAIKYAVSLEGKMTNFCRQQNYPLEIYTNGLILVELPEVIEMEFYPIKEAFLPQREPISVSQIGDILLTWTLIAIDEARDVRLSAQIYVARGGFPNTRQELAKIIKAELQNKDIRIRMTTGSLYEDFHVRDTLADYAEKDALDYGLTLTIMFYPFLVDNTLIPEVYQKAMKKLSYLFKKRIIKLGQWLKFAEDFAEDQEKQEEQGKPEEPEKPEKPEGQEK